MTLRATADDLKSYHALLQDPSVNSKVKELLQREYPDPDETLFGVFVAHSNAVATYALKLGEGQQIDLQFVKEAAWLHDIGIKYTKAPGIHCHGEEPYLRHGLIGKRLCDEMGLSSHGLVCERHVGTGFTAEEISAAELPLPARDMLNLSKEERLICYADKFFSKNSASPHEMSVIRRRLAHHSSASLARFEAMHKEFSTSESDRKSP